MEAMTCMECLDGEVWSKTLEPNHEDNLLLFLLLLFFFFFVILFFLFFLSSGLLTSLFFTLWGGWVSGLFAWPLSEPLGEFPCWSLGELSQLVFPGRFQGFSTKDLSATFVQLLPVSVAPGVCPPLVLGEHPDGGRVLASEGLGVKTLLDGLVSHLKLLSLSQLFELVLLVLVSLLKVVFVGLQRHDGVPDVIGLGSKLVRVHRLKRQGLDANSQGDPHLFLNLFLGLGHLFPGIHGGGIGLLSSLLLCGHNLLPLDLCLLLGLLLLLLRPDLLPLGLLLLQPLQLFLLLGPLIPPLADVILELLVELIFVESSFLLCEGLISLHGGVGGGLIFVVRHVDSCVYLLF